MKCRIKDICFDCDEVTGKCRIITGLTDNGGEVQCQECITEDNPKIAFNMFIGRVGTVLWNEISQKLEKNGFNKYTGKKR